MSDPAEVRSEADLEDAGLRSVYHEWNRSRGAALGPAMIDFLAIPDMVKDCIVIELPEDGDYEEGLVTFCGSGRTDWVGFEVTGKRVKELASFARAFELGRTTQKTGVPMIDGPHTVIFKPKNHLEIYELCLPLSRDGERVTGLLYTVHVFSA